ncbi:hypothetical protein PUR_35520 [Paenibacillus sp. URB8-2]|nr:hypothetical protein PUR_35520 [Paenibacillus sp. URB8-2]
MLLFLILKNNRLFINDQAEPKRGWRCVDAYGAEFSNYALIVSHTS